MKRQIIGVIAASAAAPYLVAASLFCEAVLNSLKSSDAPEISDILLSSLGVLYGGTIALIALGPPILLIASAMAAFLHALKARSIGIVLGSGLLVGLGLGLFFISPNFNRDWLILPNFCVAGTICGWIYWRVAIRRTPENSRAIDAA